MRAALKAICPGGAASSARGRHSCLAYGTQPACALPHRPLGIMREDLVEGKRFDQLARTVGTSGSRRRLLGALLVAALGGLRLRVATADDDGTVIADASGGNHNHATVIDPPTGQHDCNRDNDRNDDEGKDKAKDED